MNTTTEYTRKRRAEYGIAPSTKAANLRRSKAAEWVKANHPDEWSMFLAEAYDELGVARRKPGRPVTKPTDSGYAV